MIDADRLLQTFLAILRIDSYYPQEDAVVDVLRPKLKRVGFELSVDEHRNVMGVLPATPGFESTPPVMLCAHTDTVQPTPKMQPVIRDDAVHTDGSSVLGADDKAAVAAIVEAAETVADQGLPHPAVEILLTVGEDVGHIGSKAFDVAPVRSRMVFIPDADGPVGGIMLAAPWMESAEVTFHGRAAHAGMEPESGRNAIAMLARAIEQMPLGRIDDETTSNVGTVAGGEAANIVPPDASLVWQVRSLDESKFLKVRDEVLHACRIACDDFGGEMTKKTIRECSGFRFAPDDPIVQRAESAIRVAGLEPWHSVTCGGSDANEFNAKGLPSVVISVGYRDIHTNQESMPLCQLNHLAEVCLALMLAR